MEPADNGIITPCEINGPSGGRGEGRRGKIRGSSPSSTCRAPNSSKKKPQLSLASAQTSIHPWRKKACCHFTRTHTLCGLQASHILFRKDWAWGAPEWPRKEGTAARKDCPPGGSPLP